MKITKIALIVIYNHKYESNIQIIEELYKSRFSRIIHIMPFYQGKQKYVIPVYENSLYFEGYLTQAFEKYYNETTTHYVFIGDDLILNPNINEDNVLDFFSLPSDEHNFIPNLYELHKRSTADFWPRMRLAVDYDPFQEGLEIKKILPTFNEARLILEKNKINYYPLKFRQVYGSFSDILKRGELKNIIRYIFLFLKYLPNQKINLKYPLTGSYSDIFIISRKTIKKFIHYCGIFAAGNLFVEFAIPTALALASDKITTEPMLGKAGKTLWKKEEFKLLDKYHYNLNELFSEFPDEWLYIHPVKLSKWKM